MPTNNTKLHRAAAAVFWMVVGSFMVSLYDSCSMDYRIGRNLRVEETKPRTHSVPPLLQLWKDRVQKRNQFVEENNVMEWGGIENNNLGRVWNIYYPDWHCPYAERIGSPGDGGKWICDFPKLQNAKDGCVVYSLGLSNNDEFERAVHATAPQCEIHSFDPTPGLVEDFHMDERLAAYGAHFHDYGITATGEPINIRSKQCPTKTLYDAMAELGHNKLEILKVDIEFSEWDVFDKLLCDVKSPDCRPIPTNQVLIELHYRHSAEVVKLFQRMAEHGFGIFSFEPNPIGYPLAAEFAFVRVVDQ